MTENEIVVKTADLSYVISMKDDNNSVTISGNFDSDSTTISIANQSDTVNGPCVLELDNKLSTIPCR